MGTYAQGDRGIWLIQDPVVTLIGISIPPPPVDPVSPWRIDHCHDEGGEHLKVEGGMDVGIRVEELRV